MLWEAVVAFFFVSAYAVVSMVVFFQLNPPVEWLPETTETTEHASRIADYHVQKLSYGRNERFLYQIYVSRLCGDRYQYWYKILLEERRQDIKTKQIWKTWMRS